MSSESRSPHDAPPSDSTGGASSAVRHKRAALEVILTPIVLFLIGSALIVVAFELYPRPKTPLTPAFATLIIAAPNAQLANVNYTISPVSSSRTKVNVTLALLSNRAHGKIAVVDLDLPSGMAFTNCSRGDCSKKEEDLSFQTGRPAEAGFTVFVNNKNMGVSNNNLTASVAIPEVYYTTSQPPILFTTYHINSANSYDWSSFPPKYLYKSSAIWDEPLVPGDTVGRVVEATDHTAQSKDDNRIFIAGALIALGGAAILTALIEAVHAHDWAELRAAALPVKSR